MSLKTNTLLFAPLLLFALTLQAGAQNRWQTEELPSFRLHHMETSPQTVRDMASLIEQEYARLQSKLNLSLERRADIYLAPSNDAFDELTGHFIPHWGEGVAEPARNLIIVKAPRTTTDLARFPKLLRHELMHLLVGQAIKPPGSIPKWFHEGMAIYFSYDEEFAGGEAISKALLSDSIVPLYEIEEVLKFQREKARLAYEESYSAVLFLEDRFGYESMTAFIQDLRHSNDFEQAFYEAFGVSTADFELAWYRFVERKYRWRFLLDFETFLWILMPLVFILVFIVIKLRNRRTLRRWEQEERWG